MTFEMTQGFGKSYVGLTVYDDGTARLLVSGSRFGDHDTEEATEAVPLVDLQDAISSLFAAYEGAVAATEGGAA